MLNDIERIWVIGASTGIGKALVTALAKFDKSIIASARSEDKLDALCGQTPSKCEPQTLDITN
ncbi:SDR family NAD(P)-dependent oxidoreductase, partial [Oleiphilus sp. HI0128]